MLDSDDALLPQTLLIDLLIARSPSSLALLRAAYAHRSSSRALSYTSSATPTSSPGPAAPSQPTRSLDVAVLSAFSSNVRLRKAWEVALQGRWEDELDEGEEGDEGRAKERRERLLSEDVDQLRVALRRGGNTEIVCVAALPLAPRSQGTDPGLSACSAKVLLARSPTHLHALVAEYRKSTGGHSSLTKAIKQCIPAGTLQRVFLHAVEGAKNVSDEFGVGVWRDAKSVDKAVGIDKGGRREELLWRWVRFHTEQRVSLLTGTSARTQARPPALGPPALPRRAAGLQAEVPPLGPGASPIRAPFRRPRRPHHRARRVGQSARAAAVRAGPAAPRGRQDTRKDDEYEQSCLDD